MKGKEKIKELKSKGKVFMDKLNFNKNQWMSIAVGAVVAALVSVILTLMIGSGGSGGTLVGTYINMGPAVHDMEGVSDEELEAIVEFGSEIEGLRISELGGSYICSIDGYSDMKMIPDRGKYIVFDSGNSPFAKLESNKRGLFLYPILLEEEEAIASVEEESKIGEVAIQMARTGEYNPGIPNKVFENAWPFGNNNRAPVKIEGKWGVIDKKGNVVINPKYQNMTPFINGYAYAKEDEKYGIIDEEGNWVVEPEYDSFILNGNVDSKDINKRGVIFSRGYATVNKDGKWIHITKEGEVSEGVEENKTYFPFSENGLALVKDRGDGSTSVVDTDYEEVFKIEAKYELNPYTHEAGDGFMFSPFINGLIMVNTPDDTTMYLDEKGKSVLETDKKYDRCVDFLANGLAAVRLEETEKWGFINKEGELVIDAKYDDWVSEYYVDEKRIIVGIKDYLGVIDLEGNWIIPPNYEDIMSVENGYVIDTGNKSGIIDKKGNIIIPPSYRWISEFSNGIAVVPLDSSVTFIDEKGRFLWQAE